MPIPYSAKRGMCLGEPHPLLLGTWEPKSALEQAHHSWALQLRAWGVLASGSTVPKQLQQYPQFIINHKASVSVKNKGYQDEHTQPST